MVNDFELTGTKLGYTYVFVRMSTWTTVAYTDSTFRVLKERLLGEYGDSVRPRLARHWFPVGLLADTLPVRVETADEYLPVFHGITGEFFGAFFRQRPERHRSRPLASTPPGVV